MERNRETTYEKYLRSQQELAVQEAKVRKPELTDNEINKQMFNSDEAAFGGVVINELLQKQLEIEDLSKDAKVPAEVIRAICFGLAEADEVNGNLLPLSENLGITKRLELLASTFPFLKVE